MRFRSIWSPLLLMAVLFCSPLLASGQATTLDNDSIVQMVNWQVRDSEIIATIARNQTNFDLSPATISFLRTSRVSAQVIQAMFNATVKASGSGVVAQAVGKKPAPAAPPPAAPAPVAPAPAAPAPVASAPASKDFPADAELPSGCSTILPIGFDQSIVANNSPVQMGPSKLELSNMKRLNAAGSGGEIYTKSEVYVAFVNRLRYSVSLGGVVSVIAAPDLPFDKIFPAATPTQTPAAKAQGGAKAQAVPQKINPDDQATFDRFTDCYKNISKTFTDFQKNFNSEELLLNDTKLKITAVTTNLQPIVETANEARDAADLTIFPGHESPPFPVAALGNLQSLVAEFKTQYAKFGGWASGNSNAAKYSEASGGADAIANMLGQYLASSNATAPTAAAGTSPSEANQYEAARIYVENWRQIFRTVKGANDDYFVVTFKPACGGFFGTGTSTQMQMSVADSLNPPAAGTKVTPINLDKVVCQPTISVSNGLGLSFIPSQTPAFVPSTSDTSTNATTPQSLGYSSQSHVSAGYALQANASLWDFHQWEFEIHWSVGAMLTASTSGTTTDIITGPSFSFRRRTIFISPMYDLGLRTVYVPPFKPGMPQGSLTSPPTQQVWKSGFGLTITFPFSTGTKSTDSTNGGATASPTAPPNPKNTPAAKKPATPAP